MSIAHEILNQLGGNKFAVMTGAKNLIAGENWLSFKIMRNSKGVNHVKVILTSLDTYVINYSYVTMNKVTLKSKSENVYCDQLKKDFTKNTGLYTSL